jgi:preprotein translocase subunit YajC
MFLRLAWGMALFAQQPEEPQSNSSPIFLLLMVSLFFVFYFIVLRPQKREQAQRKAMLAGVKKNDRVVTIGGIRGVVTNVDPEADEVTIKVDEATNTKLRMTLSAIARIQGEESSKEDSSK